MKNFGTTNITQPVRTKKSCKLSGQKIQATYRDKRIMQPLGTTKITQPLSNFLSGHFEFVTVYLNLVTVCVCVDKFSGEDDSEILHNPVLRPREGQSVAVGLLPCQHTRKAPRTVLYCTMLHFTVLYCASL